MKKFLVLLLSVLMVVSSVLPAAAAYKNEYKLDIVPSITTGWGMGAQYFADLVKERSGGKINIKVYPNAQLTTGQQTNAFMLLRNGTIDFACQSTINYSPQIPELNLFALPFFFASQPDRYKAMDAVTQGRAGEMVAAAIEAKGGKFLCFGENGFRELTNSKRSIASPEDLSGLKIRVVGSPLFLDIFKALGANPVTMAWSDTISAIQQGVVDGQENPVNTFYPLKIQEYHKFVTYWHYVADPTMFVVNPKVWASFNEEDQALILQAAKEAGAYQVALARVGLDENDGGKNLEFLKSIGKAPEILDWTTTLQDCGVTITTPTPEQMQVLVDKTKPVLDAWRSKIGEELVKAAEEDMASVR
ncbi:MAG: DctP family TRAP transporter solute-binding subunit [Fretibacterium sp.]|nr:DctP family TRAP transporter solute-binding subunit [Fretibacterium sp.]